MKRWNQLFWSVVISMITIMIVSIMVSCSIISYLFKDVVGLNNDNS